MENERKSSITIGACQTPEIIGDVDGALSCIEQFASEAKNVDLLLFPECFLQGYLVEQDHLARHALDLDSPQFDSVLERLRDITPVLVFGLIEADDGRFFNSAVIVRSGSVVGSYRKVRLMEGESLFEPGDTYPVIDVEGTNLGINICSDTQFEDGSLGLAEMGATVLLVPSQNMMMRAKAEKLKDQHNQTRAQRARDSGMWVISADVTGERGSDRVSWTNSGYQSQGRSGGSGSHDGSWDGHSGYSTFA